MIKGRNRGWGEGRGGEVVTPPSKGFLTITVEGVATSARKDQRSRLVACSEGSGKPNSHGARVGEDHPNADLSNAQVEEIRDRFEAYDLGHPRHEGYLRLAKVYGVSRRTIRDIVNYRRRNVFPARWKRVTSD